MAFGRVQDGEWILGFCHKKDISSRVRVFSEQVNSAGTPSQLSWSLVLSENLKGSRDLKGVKVAFSPLLVTRLHSQKDKKTRPTAGLGRH